MKKVYRLVSFGFLVIIALTLLLIVYVRIVDSRNDLLNKEVLIQRKIKMKLVIQSYHSYYHVWPRKPGPY